MILRCFIESPPDCCARLDFKGRKRERFLAPADISGCVLLKALKKGQAVGMLPDQAPKVGEGLWLEFLAVQLTMTLAAFNRNGGCVTYGLGSVSLRARLPAAYPSSA